MQWMLYSGARKPRDFRAMLARKSAKSSLVALGLGDLVVAVADAHEREVLVDGSVGERNRRDAQFVEPAVDDVVDQAAVERLCAADVAAGRHHLQRLRYADETREALRAAGSREQPEVDFGKTELG